MIYHDIPSNENIPSYHIPIIISIYPINICIYICIYIYEYPIMSILTQYIPIIYPYFWNARHERPHGPSLAPDGRERRHQHCGARTSQRGALGCGGRVMEDLTRRHVIFQQQQEVFTCNSSFKDVWNKKLCAKSELKHLTAVGFLNPDQDTEMWANPHHIVDLPFITIISCCSWLNPIKTHIFMVKSH